MGKLNLLPHKSWNVYSQKNIEKVRQDERQAELKGESKHQRATKAEQEIRLETLRARAISRSGITNTVTELSNDHKEPFGSSSHHRTDSDHRKSKPLHHTTNQELDAEKLAEKKKWERKLTVYLGETRDGKKETPWYADMDYGRSRREKSVRPADLESRSRKDEQKKKQMDPVQDMARYLSKKKQTDVHDHSTFKVSKPKSHESGEISSCSNTLTIEELRKERLQREAKEKQRTRELLDPRKASRTEPVKHDSDERYYNAQFNPSHIRRPNHKDSDFNSRYRPY
ncbi:hypothetical protein QVD99_000196 [Batrachochytrium dendrobatidis]|nr:hypothetical protein O5D80_006432 [Batrachochytrium dendrobatidis]KAK5672687.1 hypothetical protein QVD99_000196 [Batrachochytrium dendrobatidis]